MQFPHLKTKVLKLREDIVQAASDNGVCNALFELGCLLSVAGPDSFTTGMFVIQ